MKEICFINNGENINKFKYLYNKYDLEVSNEKLFNNYFTVVKDGDDDIIIVKNYSPIYLYNFNKNDSVLDLMARGFNVLLDKEVCENELVVLTKQTNLKHIVKPLENLDKIANKYCIAKEEIIAMNNLKGENVFVGQILWI